MFWCASKNNSTTPARARRRHLPPNRRSRRNRAQPPSLKALRRRPPRPRPRPPGAGTDTTVRLIFITLLALILASAIGLGSTYMTATKGTEIGTLKIGAWTARPKTGTADVDPYSRASIVRSGELPVGTGDGVAFTALTDDKNKPLDGRCDVVV